MATRFGTSRIQEIPKIWDEYVCRGSQSDVSVYKNLFFVSGEATSGRLDCGLQGVQDSVSKERFRGIRIFDATDLKKPKYVHSVQTCRGSHTHSILVPPDDPNNIYIYVSGSAAVRSPNEARGMLGAVAGGGPEQPVVQDRSHQGSAGESGGRDCRDEAEFWPTSVCSAEQRSCGV